MTGDDRHLPYPAPIEAYGSGGFRFAGLSHRGSLLCLPDGIWPWPVAQAEEITEQSLEPVFVRADAVSLLLIGAGSVAWFMPPPLRQRCKALGIAVETSSTGRAIATYNIVLGEGRRVAAALIAEG